ncbi:MAG: hypothetical protein ACYDCO_01245 [Armatimonadota bacterium]
MAGSCSRFLPRLIVSLLLLLLGGLMPAFAQSAQPGDLTLGITFMTADGAICAHEPLLARIELVNKAKEPVSVPMLTSLEITDSDGKVVAAIPPPEVSLDFFHATHDLLPGEKYCTLWVISALYQFDTPGTYTLHVHWLQYQGGGKLVDLVAGTANIRALPFDEARVTARCEELYQPLYRNNQVFTILIDQQTYIVPLPKDEMGAGLRARALRSVRHDLALPYLDWMAHEWENADTCYAIRQIGTPRAAALLEALAKRQDNLGKAARSALTMTHKVSIDDVAGLPYVNEYIDVMNQGVVITL